MPTPAPCPNTAVSISIALCTGIDVLRRAGAAVTVASVSLDLTVTCECVLGGVAWPGGEGGSAVAQLQAHAPARTIHAAIGCASNAALKVRQAHCLQPAWRNWGSSCLQELR
jgi:hypothetical protein